MSVAKLTNGVKTRQTGYAARMTDFARLMSAAYKAELSASRRMASRTGCSPEQALRDALLESAGAGSLAELLDAR
ncbi:MAG: hypothetical protein GZ089_12140, partial [Aromatoleum sp.]|nr:hypothetical protein [Aromatoleum sp.]